MMPIRSSGVNSAGSRSSHGKSEGFQAARLAFSYSAASDSVLTGHSRGKILFGSISGAGWRPSFGIINGGITRFDLPEPSPRCAAAALAIARGPPRKSYKQIDRTVDLRIAQPFASVKIQRWRLIFPYRARGPPRHPAQYPEKPAATQYRQSARA